MTLPRPLAAGQFDLQAAATFACGSLHGMFLRSTVAALAVAPLQDPIQPL